MKIQLIYAFLLFTGILGAQTQLYVSPTGNDANPGTVTLPFQTVQHAVNSSAPGTTIYLMGGTYYELVNISMIASASNPFVLTNYNNQNAVISAPANDSCCPLLHILNSTYVTVSGIEFSDFSANNAKGIHVDGISNHVDIMNNKVHDIHFSFNQSAPADSLTKSWPILVDCDHAPNPATNITISGNEIYNCRTGNSGAITFTGNVDGFLISNNLVHDISNSGIYIEGHQGICSVNQYDAARNGILRWNRVWNCSTLNGYGAGIFANGSRDCIIENNNCFSNGYGIEIACSNPIDTAYGFTVRNNLVYLNQKAGIMTGIFGPYYLFGKVNNCTFNNNTLANNTAGPPLISEITLFTGENIDIRNNIVVSDHYSDAIIFIPNSVTATLDDNLYYSVYTPNFVIGSINYNSLTSYISATSQDSNSIFTDPLFVNLSGQNYHLTSSSPAIDRGDSLYVAAPGETDMDSMNRVQSGRVDIGAYEYNIASGIPFVAQQDEMFITNDPATGLLTVMLSHPAQRDGLLSIYNMEGKLVSSTMIYNGARSAVLSTSGLAAGTYLVHTNVIDAQAVKFVK